MAVAVGVFGFADHSCSAWATGTKGTSSSSPPLSSNKEFGVGTVYIAQTVDAETYRFTDSIYNQNLDLRSFGPGKWGYVDYVMSPQFRNANRDSYGGMMKITWFLLSGEPFCQSEQHDCAIIHSAMYRYIHQMDEYGDMIGWHYHDWGWTDEDGDGRYFWNELLSFNGRPTFTQSDRNLAEKALSYLIIEKQVYPNVFRSGWSWENTDFSNWLDDIAPFDFSALSPVSNTVKIPPDHRANVFDWSRAPVTWVPYHPWATDYQTPGELKRWQFHISNSIKEIAQAFQAADSGRNVLVTHFTHTYDGYNELNYNWQLADICKLHPRVSFRYVTALEGARRVLGLTDTSPPVVECIRDGSQMVVICDEPLFTFPYAAVRDGGEYFRLMPVQKDPTYLNGGYAWKFELPRAMTVADGGIPRVISFGCCDPSGNYFITDPISF